MRVRKTESQSRLMATRYLLFATMFFFAGLTTLTRTSHAQTADSIADILKTIDVNLLPRDAESTKQHQRMLHNHAQGRLREVNHRVSQAWHNIKTRDQWEAFVDPRIEHLRQAIADFPKPPKELRHVVTKTIDGDGFIIRNVVYESRPGLLVTANLYSPKPLRQSMPGIVIVHSHHRPKAHSELQDMGMNWARQGCYVLVPDQLNHGERRQHPFVTDKDYAKSFRASRQDYYFRYNIAMQLYLAGDSLIGQMAWDNMRGFDLLLLQKHIDDSRLIIIGSVAGGGDPAAVTAALDPRIDCLVPFNFGGPQPETRFPLPDDIETSFNYAGSGSWESTRNIAFSASQTAGKGREFLPWVIVSSIAPRHLVHAHEFNWDHARDPVWKRYQTVWGNFYNRKNRLGYTNGHGELKQSSKVASHCTHVGPVHRKLISQNFKNWFNIETPEPEFRGRVDEKRLLCMTPEVNRKLGGQRLHQLLLQRTNQRLTEARTSRSKLSRERVRSQLKQEWTTLLALNLEQLKRVPKREVRRVHAAHEPINWLGHRLIINDQSSVPIFYFLPKGQIEGKPPVVIMIAQGGKAKFMENRREAIAQLLAKNIGVCLIDVRGTGETAPGSDRGQYSWSTSLAASELMLGKPLLGARLSDLLQTIAWLRADKTFDGKRIAIWGDSFSEPYAADTPSKRFQMPLRVDGLPRHAEPLGSTLALLAALFDDDIKAVYTRGGLTGFRSLLETQFIHVPFDAIVPGTLKESDLPDVVAALSPMPIWMTGIVDSWNRTASDAAIKMQLSIATQVYGKANVSTALNIDQQTTEKDVTAWLVKILFN